MCFALISEQTAIISLHSFNLSVFITETENVYCAVRTRSLNQTAKVPSFKCSSTLISKCQCSQEGIRGAQWLRHWATNRKGSGSILDGVNIRNKYQEYFLWVKAAGA
jgi:hypothetical protein